MRGALDATARPFNKGEQTRIASHSQVMDQDRKARTETLARGVPALPEYSACPQEKLQDTTPRRETHPWAKFRTRNATEDRPVLSLPFRNELSDVLWCELKVLTQINALL